MIKKEGRFSTKQKTSPSIWRISISGILQVILLFSSIFTVGGFFSRYAWYLDIFSHFRFQCFVLLFLLSLLSLVLKEWKILIVSVVLCMVNLFQIIPLYVSYENNKTVLPDKSSEVELRISKGSEMEDTEKSEDADYELEDSFGKQVAADIIREEGSTVQDRFKVPEGFERIPVEEGSFQEYLRNLPLKPHGSIVKYYNGNEKSRDVYDAVIDMDVGDRDLQQCADAVMRLRAEYLYGKGFYDRIHFNFTNGFKADYVKWMNGNRITVKGNDTYWVKKTDYSEDYKVFRQYMDMVFAYDGTLSLSAELKAVSVNEMEIGDIFMKGALPGHCVIVVDMAVNNTTGEKIFMLAQSYMPAQDIHVLKNYNSQEISPWYSINFDEALETPEWTFYKDQLMRFEN
ncbi:MAG: hypothetical protein BWY74_00886 [Firmicutes bacterium ADurb.Bin419]|nr:MAG: hypothetical protein BWY74_00886 [Firmicutes bacterium ADurb.Bin419]